ncbi:MAG: alpha/beta fold hydrolase, partial [Planctomycetia bacterium]|nr:alpha/beta fold hydrolase [Planctomycetia bacterium]
MLRATLPSRPSQGPNRGYGRRPPLILINGMAEQAESWFCNLEVWRRHFEVYLPNLLVYEGMGLHRRIAEGLPIDVEYLVAQLHRYLEDYVQTPPFHLVANSLGGKIAVEYAARYPDLVDRVVLLCPSGLTAEESLPLVDGVRRTDPHSLVGSVFHDGQNLDPGVIEYYGRQFGNRRWRTGLLRTIRGTMEHRVRDRLAEVRQPTLLVVGREDRIVDPQESIDA